MWLKELLANEILISAIVSWFIAQTIKVLLVLIEDKKINFERFVGSGGMPSSHSSFVTSLATAVGILEGFNGSEFAMAAVFALPADLPHGELLPHHT